MKSASNAKIAKKKVLLRVDFNVPLDEKGEIADDTRIKLSMPTIDYFLNKKNRLILVSHLGRPEGRDMDFSLKKIANYLQRLYPNYTVSLINDFLVPEDNQKITKQNENEIILLENIRFFEEEKNNDAEFSKNLASLADVYVNDAFAVSHRTCASIVGVTNYLPSYAGLTLTKEIEMMDKVIKNPKNPSVAAIGGAKISTKIALIEKLIDLFDNVLLGGGLANNLLKAKGINIGHSIYEEDALESSSMLLISAKQKKDTLVLPSDVMIGNPDNKEKSGQNKKLNELGDDSYILDIGRKTREKYASIISKAKTIIWNGPMGLVENPRYRAGTDAVLEAIIKNEKALSIVGGGDTLAAIKDKKGTDKITHISTGGGAMLEFIEKGTLPGIEALNSYNPDKT